MDKKIANKIFNILEKKYPRVTTSLTHKNPLELLVATILSAQCTDKMVNIVTKSIFKKYKKASDYADADLGEFEGEIKSTGFYRNKAKNIIASGKIINGKFKGKVPSKMKDLITLPGVARKTANIVLYHAYGKNVGVAVDTHVRRISFRLGLTKNKDPKKIEQDLMEIFSERNWGKLTNLFVEHGRDICDARKPLCRKCQLKNLCPSFSELSS